MKKNIRPDERTIPYGNDGDYVVLVASDTTPDDVDCIIEALEGEAWYAHWCEFLVGRPRKFETVDDLYEKATTYFQECSDEFRPLTVTGLCNALGTFRDVLDDYQKGKYGEDFVEAVKHLKQIVEQGYEERLHSSAATGAMFALTNFGWKNTYAHEISGPGGKPIETQNNTATLKDYTKEQLYELLGKME
jgi:hypothetical protein